MRPDHGDPRGLEALLEFAVHDLGSLGIGALIIYRPDDGSGPVTEARLPLPPSLEILRPLSLSPLRHALRQIDGAGIFDASGPLRPPRLRLVPTAERSEVRRVGQGRGSTGRSRWSPYPDTQQQQTLTNQLEITS